MRIVVIINPKVSSIVKKTLMLCFITTVSFSKSSLGYDKFMISPVKEKKRLR